MTRSSPPPRAATAHWIPLILLLAALAACTSTGPDDVAIVESPLSADQCSFFADGDKVTICHRTASQNNPYVVIKTNYAGCAAGHVGHVGDYVTTIDPTCRDKGCYPEGAPADDLVPCCGGEPDSNGICPAVDACKLTPCSEGELCEDLPAPAVGDATGRTCTPDLCWGVTCEPKDKCHASACDPKTGACASTPLSGDACDDGDTCTGDDSCKDGTCIGQAIEGCGGPTIAKCALKMSSPSVATPKDEFVADFTMTVAGHEGMTFDAPLHVSVGFESIGGRPEANFEFSELVVQPDADGVITARLARSIGLLGPKIDGVYTISAYARTRARAADDRALGLHCFTNETSLQVVPFASK